MAKEMGLDPGTLAGWEQGEGASWTKHRKRLADFLMNDATNR